MCFLLSRASSSRTANSKGRSVELRNGLALGHFRPWLGHPGQGAGNAGRYRRVVAALHRLPVTIRVGLTCSDSTDTTETTGRSAERSFYGWQHEQAVAAANRTWVVRGESFMMYSLVSGSLNEGT